MGIVTSGRFYCTRAMAFLTVCILGTALAFVNSAAGSVEDVDDSLFSFSHKVKRTTPYHTSIQESAEPPHTYHSLAQQLARNTVRRKGELLSVGGAYPDAFYRFVPINLGDAHVGGPAVQWEAPCFRQSSATATWKTESTLTLTLELSKPKSLLCKDYYIFATTHRFHYDAYFRHGKHTITWEKTMSEDEKEDVEMNGIRLLRFPENMVATVADALATVRLFTGASKPGKPGVPEQTAKSNLKFLLDYAGMDFPERSAAAASTILGQPGDGVEIQSGDLIGILRLDGLDPLIAWGTGSRLGHTTMALEIDGEMHVVESQVKSNYWPTNFVQRTPLAKWLKQAQEADFNVVLLPLSQQARAKFNSTEALEWFESKAEGLLYGYQTLLSGWIDSADKNLPSYVVGSGAAAHLGHDVMVLFAILDPILSKFVYSVNKKTSIAMPNIWSLTMAKRAGMPNVKWNTSVLEAYAYAREHNITLETLMGMPEQDSWVYPAGPGFREGRSMVCDVFVCNMWRAGGLITNKINCGEFTPLDLYELNHFATPPKNGTVVLNGTVVPAYSLPAACKAADPDSPNPFCQLMGKYRMDIPHYNSQAPFDGMRERCPSQGPDYAERFSPKVKATC